MNISPGTYIGRQHVALIDILLLRACYNCSFVIGSLNSRLTRSLRCLFFLRRCRRLSFLNMAFSFCWRWRGSRSYGCRRGSGSACLCGPSFELSLQMRLDRHAQTLHGRANVGRQGLVFADGTLLRESGLA